MLRQSLIITLTCIFLIEGIARLDPLGIVAYHNDLVTANLNWVPMLDNRYVLRPGKIRFTHWEANITDQYTRYTYPQNIHADCAIAIVGDSVTFGQGVGDAQTFATWIATDNQNVNWLNAGMMGYNTRNVYDRIQSLDADGYVWLTIQNDLGGESLYGGFVSNRRSLGYVSVYIDYRIGTLDYIDALTHRNDIPVYADGDIAEHVEYAERIADRNDVLIFAFNDLPAEYRPDGAIVIEKPASRISWFDGHPNAAGHRAIYEQMRPATGEFVQDIC